MLKRTEATFLREVFISSRKIGLSWTRLYRINQTQLENQCPCSLNWSTLLKSLNHREKKESAR